MDISHQFHQIGILLTDNGLIPVLEEMAVAIVPLIESHHIPGQKAPHAKSQRDLPRFAEQVKVVWQKGPGINLKTVSFSEESESGKEVLSILIGQEDPSFLDTSPHNMMEDTRSV